MTASVPNTAEVCSPDMSLPASCAQHIQTSLQTKRPRRAHLRYRTYAPSCNDKSQPRARGFIWCCGCTAHLLRCVSVIDHVEESLGLHRVPHHCCQLRTTCAGVALCKVDYPKISIVHCFFGDKSSDSGSAVRITGRRTIRGRRRRRGVVWNVRLRS